MVVDRRRRTTRPDGDHQRGCGQYASVARVGSNRLVLGSIQCFVRMPRWQACVYFASLYGVLPAATAAVTILALFGLGAILRPPRDGEDALGLLSQRFALGLLAGFALAALWCAIPHDWRRFPGRTAAVGAVLSIFAVRGAFVFRRTAAAGSLERVVWTRMVWVVLLLLADVAVETAVINQNRIRPIDFLFAQQGAQRLSAELPVPWLLAQRPWLLHVLFAPIDAITGRFSYWAYQGFIAGLNATAIIGAAMWLRRWKGDGAIAAVGVFALLPLWTAYHFFGQRALSAGLVLLAAFWWTERRERWWAWGGLAIALERLGASERVVHPSWGNRGLVARFSRGAARRRSASQHSHRSGDSSRRLRRLDSVRRHVLSGSPEPDPVVSDPIGSGFDGRH